MRVPSFCAVALVVVLAAAACTSSTEESQTEPGVSGTRAVRIDPRLDVTGAEVVSPVRAVAPLDAATRRAAMRVLERVFRTTMVGPLQDGRRGGSVAGVFTVDAAYRAMAEDRAGLFDEGLPRVDVLVADRTDVQLTALADQDDRPSLIIAKVDWELHGDGGVVRVHRAGEFSLVPAFGKWVVGGYALLVNRTVGATTTTTAVAR